MFIIIGSFSLWMALILTICEILTIFLIKKVSSVRWNRWRVTISYGQTFFLGVAIFILLIALLMDDTQFAYVFHFSDANLPLLLKMGALWGNNAGSILLWLFFLSIWKSSFLLFSSLMNHKIQIFTIFVLGIVSFVFLLYLIIFFNPLTPIIATSHMVREGLNPLLQDYGMGIHPPLLYAGMLGFSVPWGVALALLIQGQWDIRAIRIIRIYSLLSFIILSAGIILGGWWSYRTLGWGGWWGWDPVENLSLFPWLIGIALLHALYISHKYNTFKVWTVFLAILSFSMSLFGTVIIRSGLLISSHAFIRNISNANTFLMIVLFLILGSALALLVIRMWQFKNTPIGILPTQFLYVLFSSILIFLFMVTVALGTFYPITLDVLNMGKISVGAPYFNFMIIMFSIPTLLILTILTANRAITFKGNASVKTFTIHYMGLFILSFLGALLFYFTVNQGYLDFLINLLAFSLILSSVILFIKQIFILKSIQGSVITHLGIAIMAFGILNNATGTLRNVEMKVGDSLMVYNQPMTLKGFQWEKANNYIALKAVFSYGHTYIRPSLRFYSDQKYLKSVPYIQSKGMGDIYVSLGQLISDKIWRVQVLTKPFMHIVWLGSFVIILGGILALFNLFLHKKSKLKKEEVL